MIIFPASPKRARYREGNIRRLCFQQSRFLHEVGSIGMIRALWVEGEGGGNEPRCKKRGSEMVKTHHNLQVLPRERVTLDKG